MANAPSPLGGSTANAASNGSGLGVAPTLIPSSFWGSATETTAISGLFESVIAAAVLLAALLLLAETPAYPLAYGILGTAVVFILLESAGTGKLQAFTSKFSSITKRL
jgi:hypothetical protein